MLTHLFNYIFNDCEAAVTLLRNTEGENRARKEKRAHCKKKISEFSRVSGTSLTSRDNKSCCHHRSHIRMSWVCSVTWAIITRYIPSLCQNFGLFNFIPCIPTIIVQTASRKLCFLNNMEKLCNLSEAFLPRLLWRKHGKSNCQNVE